MENNLDFGFFLKNADVQYVTTNMSRIRVLNSIHINFWLRIINQVQRNKFPLTSVPPQVFVTFPKIVLYDEKTNTHFYFMLH